MDLAFICRQFVIVRAGAAGLMTARELWARGKRVTVVEARDRCGGRNYPLPDQAFGCPASAALRHRSRFWNVCSICVRSLGRKISVAADHRNLSRRPKRPTMNSVLISETARQSRLREWLHRSGRAGSSTSISIGETMGNHLAAVVPLMLRSPSLFDRVKRLQKSPD